MVVLCGYVPCWWTVQKFVSLSNEVMQKPLNSLELRKRDFTARLQLVWMVLALSAAVFNEANLSDADFSPAECYNCLFMNANLTIANLTNACVLQHAS